MHRSASRRLAALCVLTAALAACQPLGPGNGTISGPGDSGSGGGAVVLPGGTPPSIIGTITDQDRVGAMLSIHAHARYFPAHNLTGEFMPLDDAIEILRSDVGIAADSRRRRAAAKLAAYWLHKFPLTVVGQRIQALAGVAARQAVETYLFELGGLVLPPAVTIEHQLSKKLVFLTPNCKWDPVLDPLPPDEDPCDDPSNPPVGPNFGWTIRVLFPRQLPDVARCMDPQSWDDCSALFRKSYLTDRPYCCTKSPVNPCKVPTDVTQDPQAISPPKARGRPYPRHGFFEEFCYDRQGHCGSCASLSCDISFRNLMCVNTEYSPAIEKSDQLGQVQSHHVGYRLGETVTGELSGVEGRRLSTDLGHIDSRHATPQEIVNLQGPNWTFVEVYKDMTLEGSGQSNEAARLICSFVDEIANEIKDHGCCWVPFQPWGTNRFFDQKDWIKRMRKRQPPYKVPRPPLERPGLPLPIPRHEVMNDADR